jgi:hypothetical protein
VCANDLSANCITKAKKEAFDAFSTGEINKAFLEGFRRDILDSSWDDLGKRLAKISMRH